MQARNIHVPSIVIGVLAATVVLMSMGQSSPVLGPPRIEYGPHPRDMVQIKQGTPYTVPAGRIFVLTGLGDNQNLNQLARLQVDGQDELTMFGATGGAYPPSPSVGPVPVGLTVAGGRTVTIVSSNQGRAWGYLSQP